MKSTFQSPRRSCLELAGLWFICFALAIRGDAADREESSANPFGISPSLQTSNGSAYLRVRLEVPPKHHLYRDKVSFELEGESSPVPFVLPEALVIQDKFSGAQKQAYERSFEASYLLPTPAAKPITLTVHFQGCNETACYFPETKTFRISPGGEVVEVLREPAPEASSSNVAGDWRGRADKFSVASRGTGYMNPKGFLSFLDRLESTDGESAEATSFLMHWGWLATLGFILAGGLGLNLTPCILPLIPINLAIIGAGAKSSNRQRGFMLGGAYGVGMALAYGTLGLVVVLTGSKFGALNSSAWFNWAIAGVFVLLGLGMFDVVSIDFSRFQSRPRPNTDGAPRSQFLLALTMGGIAALLAGACVAPVVISVLLLSAKLYSQGAWLGLLLPFLLGLGMAIPWPFAGAGLSFLPKPGQWMTRVKYGFGSVIVLFAAYYGYLGFSLIHQQSAITVTARATGEGQMDGDVANRSLAVALAEALEDGRPVLIDFWASWCKNCAAMEHSTFKESSVVRRLEQFHFVKYQAERPNQPPAKEVLDYFGVMGLPTYVMLVPGSSGTNSARQSSAAKNPATTSRLQRSEVHSNPLNLAKADL